MSAPTSLIARHAGTRSLGGQLDVARLGYGAMQLPGPGVWGPPKDQDEAVRVLRRAVESGVNHVDTSDAYGPHVANELIHAALHPYPDELVIGTKVGLARTDQGAWVAAPAPAQLEEQLEQNLRRLGVDRLDLVYLRVGGDGLLAPDPAPLERSWEVLARAQERGTINRLGLSGVTTDQLQEAHRLAPVAAVQNRYHVFDRSSADVLAVCERLDITFVPYFPLAAGLLRPGLDLAQLPAGMAPEAAQLKALDDVASRHGSTRVQTALAWILARSPVTVAIPGTSSTVHLDENLAAAQLNLTPADVDQLDAVAGPGARSQQPDE